MPTLYELLEALPEDGADGLRAAFRKAAKANHPDNNPDDPDAPQRFRRIVRAHAILSDKQQRTTYDACLANAQRQRAAKSKFSRFRGLLSQTISAMFIALVSIGAFLLIENVLRAGVVSPRVEGISVPRSALADAMPTQPSRTVGRADGYNKFNDIAVANEPEVSDAVREVGAPIALAAAGDTGVIQATSEVGAKQAGYYRERGGLAYRSGDLALALVDLDLAINLDPDFSDAYIDRAIVFRRMGDLKRAFADVAQAKHIDDQKVQQVAPPPGNN